MAIEPRKKKLTYAASFLCFLIVSVWWWTGGLDRVMAADSTGRTKAQSLVAAYAKHVGAHDAVHQMLDADNDRSFGDFGFHYFPQRDVLQARVYIVRTNEKDRPETAAGSAQVTAGLNDPKIGGMYDRGGGYFFHDKEKQIKFLAKDYKVAETSASEFVRDVDNLNGLAGIWVTNWFAHAARQSYGAEPLPTQHITRDNDPYKR